MCRGAACPVHLFAYESRHLKGIARGATVNARHWLKSKGITVWLLGSLSCVEYYSPDLKLDVSFLIMLLNAVYRFERMCFSMTGLLTAATCSI